MHFTIVRHGETIENKQSIVQGQIDGTLSDEGVEQASKVGSRLKDETYDYIYCSDLGRTKNTLSQILPHHTKTPVSYVQQLREFSRGEWEGRPSAECDWDSLPGDTTFRKTPPGGEPLPQFYARVEKFMNEIKQKHTEEDRILFVTHGGTIAMLNMYLLGIHWKVAQCFNNTSVSKIEARTGQPNCAWLLNCTAHLQ